MLDDPSLFWLVGDGYLDVFCVPVSEAGTVLAQGIHCFRLTAGDIVLGCAPSVSQGASYALRGYASATAALERGTVVSLLQEDFDLSIVAKIDRWVQVLDVCLSRLYPLPAQYHLLMADPDIPYEKGAFLSSHYGSVVWARAETSELRYGDLSIATGEFTPITHRSARELMQSSAVSGCYTPQLLSDDRIDTPTVIRNFQNFFMHAIAVHSKHRSMQNVRGQRRFARDSASQLRRTQVLFGRTLNAPIPEQKRRIKGEDPLVRIVARALADWDMALPAYDNQVIMRGSIKEILSHLGIGARKIDLTESDLRRENSGHIIYAIGGSYRLLLPPFRSRKTYRCFNPQTGTEEALPAADDLPKDGFMLYPPLSAHIRTLPQLLKHAFMGESRDLGKFFAVAVLNGLFFLVFPFLVSKLLTTWIPYQEWGIFLTSLLGFFLTAFASIVMYYFNATLYVAIKGHVFTKIQSGLWQRLLNLPVEFFRKHSVGEIVDRANAMNIVDKFFNVSIAQSFSALVSALVSLILLMFFNPLLATVVWAILCVVIVIDYFLLKAFVALQLRADDIHLEVNNFTMQVINALAKLRVSRRENFALRQWAERTTRKAKLVYRAGLLGSAHNSLHMYFFYYTHIAIFATIIYVAQQGSLTSEALTADFLVFNSALMQVSFALMQAAILSGIAVGAVPYLVKVKPIFAASGEGERRGVRLHNLRGRVEFSSVHFAYPSRDGGLREALHDISFTVNPGEYVAIVGASGSGKSTLIRLLLGFERPRRGSLYIDDYDIDTLNLTVLRRQMGVVLQTNQIVPETVMKNISLGFEPLSDFDLPTLYRRSWEAAEQAGVAQEIRNLPMNMDSWLGMGQGLSGGQKQRLLIARALSKRPRIMVLDEATSAMDNVTQRLTMGMLSSLNITRIVIAHRLSTISNVNRVIMMKKGRIIEQGSFRGLLQAGGEFSKFAKRQML